MSKTNTTIRIGGVPEHFNLPWLAAIEEGLFAAAGYNVEWIDFPGGTGAIMKALDAGEVDIATPLTEGAVTAIVNGNPSRFVSVWVDSPLLWGIHIAASAQGAAVADLEGQRFAISRFGSGSDLMARVLAEEHGWEITDDHFVVVGGLDGAIDALPAGDAEIFLWNKTMTQPHVTDGTFARAGVLPTPWPSFAVVASTAFLDTHPGAAAPISVIARMRAAALADDDTLAQQVVDRYGLALDSATEWVDQVEWTAPTSPVDTTMLTDVAERMQRLGRIDSVPSPVTDLVS